MMRRIAVAACLFLISLTSFAQSRKALVLDNEAKSVAVVDAAAGTVGDRVALTDTPQRMILSPDGKRIAVLSRGEGKTSFWTAFFNPTTKSSVTLIDSFSMKQIARVELGWDLGRAAFSADSSALTVLTPGVTSKKPDEVKPAELIRINPKTGEILKRVPLDRAAESFDVSSNGETGAIFFKSSGPSMAQLRLIDVGTLDRIADITLSNKTDAPFALIKDNLYLVDKGTKSGKLYIVALTDRKLAATLDAGDFPVIGAVDPDKGNIYLLNSNGELRILNSTTLSAPVKVANNPVTVRFSDDKKTAYVISNAAVTTVDLTKMTASTPIKVRGSASDFVASPDARRGFVLHRDQACCRATVVDLSSGTEMKSFMTGSKGARIGQGLAAAAMTLGSYQAGRSAALSHGGGTFYYTVYTPRIAKAARGPLAMRPDGKFAYYLDTQTNDVTVVDGESGERVKNIGVGGGGQELVVLANGKYVAAVSDDSVIIIDTDKNEMAKEIKLSGDVSDFEVSAKGDYAAVVGKGKIVVIDVHEASQVAAFDAFKRPVQFIFMSD